MFSEDQVAALEAPLNSGVVRQRRQAGTTLSYVEGWHVIAEANRIFGHGMWERETLEMREVRTPEEVDMKWRVGFVAKCRITVRSADGATFREGWGYGSGIAKDLGDAYESAVKEAETDAMKRALMTFGNPFGLALYDKDRRNVSATPVRKSAAQAKRDGDYERCMEMIHRTATLADLKAVWATIYTDYLPTLPESWAEPFAEAKDKRKAELSGGAYDNALPAQRKLLDVARNFCNTPDDVDEFRATNAREINKLPSGAQSILDNELEALRDNLSMATAN